MSKLVQLKDKDNNNLYPKNVNYEKRLEKLEGYILYENYSGSNENVTLSDNVSNYNFLEIYYYDRWSSIRSSKKIDVHNNFNTSLEILNGQETVIGTWNDGKKIYSKTIDFHASTETKSFPIENIASNINQIWIDASKSFYKMGTYGGIVSDWEIESARFRAVIDANALYYACSSNLYANATITFNYTKTTD